MFDHGRPSFTAEIVCIYRAIGSHLGWCHDPFAYEFLDWDARIYVRVLTFAKYLLQQRLVLGRAQYLSARTAYLDQFILNNQSEQIVLLGAGLDSRAYRLWSNLPQNVRIYEVDAPATQRHKLSALNALMNTKSELFKGKSLDQFATFVTCNFATNESFTQKLMEKGFDPSNPKTTVILEGVASYLTKDELTKTLKEIATYGPGTRFAMNVIENHVRTSLTSKLLKRFIGEEWKFAWKRGDDAGEFFEPLGYRVLDAQPFEQVIAELESLKREMHPKRTDNYIFALEICSK